MGQSRIKSIQANGTFDSQNGLRYKWECELEDGTAGEVVTVSQGRWNVGDEVEYTSQQSPYGVKLKLSKPGMAGGFGGGGARKADPSVQKRIDASWAIGQAVAMLGVVADTDEYVVGEYLANVRKLADSLLNIRNEKV